jgi:hypothetical protein
MTFVYGKEEHAATVSKVIASRAKIDLWAVAITGGTPSAPTSRLYRRALMSPRAAGSASPIHEFADLA